MKLCVVSLIFCIKLVSSVDFNEIVNHYNELGCTSIHSENDPEQIARFDCSFTKSSFPENKCVYKGKEYEISQKIDDEENESKCSAACICLKQFDGSMGFTCAHIDCPEFFGRRDMTNNCVRQYSLGSCCSKGEVCGEDMKKELAVCKWDGESYLEGQQFYPKDNCVSCVCSKDFNGSLDGPWCRKVNCGTELHHMRDLRKNCAPVYFENKNCCPIQWKCMDESDEIQKKASVKSGNPENKCNYGSHTLDVGDEIKGSDKCVTCKCQVPPLVSCVRLRNC